MNEWGKKGGRKEGEKEGTMFKETPCYVTIIMWLKITFIEGNW